jgi:hypothetical protein
MDYIEAKRLFEKQWVKKKNQYCVFPYNKNYIDDEFIEVTVPIEDCKTQAIQSELVNKYINTLSKGVKFGPSWVIYGKRLKNGDVIPFWHKKLYVLDGNHRITSKLICGATMVNVIIPRSNYKLYGIK